MPPAPLPPTPSIYFPMTHRNVKFLALSLSPEMWHSVQFYREILHAHFYHPSTFELRNLIIVKNRKKFLQNRKIWYSFCTFIQKMNSLLSLKHRNPASWYPCGLLHGYHSNQTKPATWIPPQPNHTETPTHIEPRTIRPMW